MLVLNNWQVLKGSHLAGRVEHVAVGEQNGADLERVNELKKVRKDTKSYCINLKSIPDNAIGPC